MKELQVGDSVYWSGAIDSMGAKIVGTVKRIIPSDSGLIDFHLYEIGFPFGFITVHGKVVEPVGAGVSPPDGRSFASLSD